MIRRGILRFCFTSSLVLGGIVNLASSSHAADGVSPAPPAQNLSVQDCSPCLLNIQPGEPPYEVRFKVKVLGDGTRIIEEIRLSQKDSGKQAFPVHDMTPIGMSDNFLLGTADINFDGFNDLFVITSQGVANAYADYWLFLPSTTSFSYLGIYPILKVDSSKRQVSSYERGGFGGLEYEKKEYKFINGQLAVVASEKQESTTRQGVFRRKFFAAKGG